MKVNMTAREELIQLIKTAPPEVIKQLAEIMLSQDINLISSVAPHTVRQ